MAQAAQSQKYDLLNGKHRKFNHPINRLIKMENNAYLYLEMCKIKKKIPEIYDSNHIKMLKFYNFRNRKKPLKNNPKIMTVYFCFNLKE